MTSESNAKDKEQTNPSTTAHFLSRLFFSWLGSLMKLGSKRPLTDEDLYPLLDDCKSSYVISQLDAEWKRELKACYSKLRTPRLWVAILRVVGLKSYLVIFFLAVLSSLANVTHPLFLGFFVKLLADPSRDNASVVLCTLGLGATVFSKKFFMHHSNFLAEFWGMRMRVAIIGLIYNKILVLSRGTLSRIGTGHIINLVSNDVYRLERASRHLQEVLLAPIEVVSCMAIMWTFIGWQSLVGIGFFFLTIIFNISLSNVVANLRLRATQATDKRLGVMSEIICGIRAVKMNAWEWSFADRVKELRRKEIKIIRIIGTVTSTFVSLLFVTVPIAALISVATLLFTGGHLTPSTLFTLLAYLSVVRFSVCVSLGDALVPIREFGISLQRFQHFLLEDSLDEAPTSNFDPSQNETESKIQLQLSNVSCVWDKKDISRVVKNVSMSLPTDKLGIITGPVGSGKSSLLMAMLGELPIIEGNICRRGTVVYASQTPWVFSGTLQENILFGRAFDFQRYQEVLEACDLVKDIDNFPNSNATMVGQRGVTLSGGQRARVSLARAIYSKADIYLFDDPLSAVDATVGKKIFERCIQTLLMGKLRLLVTHQLQFLSGADYILVMKHGRVSDEGTYKYLAESNALKGIEETTFSTLCSNNSNINWKKVETTGKKSNEIGLPCLATTSDKEDVKELLEEDEDTSSGSVTLKLYWCYLRAGLPTSLLILLGILLLVGQGALMAPTWWLSQLSEMSHANQAALTNLYIYGGLVLSAIALQFVRGLFLYLTAIRSAVQLHDKMTNAVIKAPILLFDSTPAGRILNRFSKDIGSMDGPLPDGLVFSTQSNIACVATILFSVTATPWIVLAILPLAVVFLLCARYYLKSSRELMRLQAVRCSPVYSHVTETIAGIDVIRPSGMDQHFRDQFDRYLDRHSEAFSMVISAIRWLAIRLDCLAALFIFVLAVAEVLFSINPAVAGLALIFAVDTLDNTSYGIRLSSDVENLMTSVERVISYTETQPEPGYDVDARPPDDWPDCGSFEVKNMSLVYHEGGREVLKDINFSIDSKEKVGVVGRTGAGKSSLISALFRLPEPQGEILIDGVNILKLNVQSARRAMSVITQDPVLFSGSIRENLDPLRRFQDSQLWASLEEVQMKSVVQKLPGEMSYNLTESGSNFSAGERQLLCLARALLQGNKIIVMDEATANVDLATDCSIQKVVRGKCSDCTVITIAHRLNTVVDYDKIMVLHCGQIVEFDNPSTLLADNQGAFSQLVQSHNLTINDE